MLTGADAYDDIRIFPKDALMMTYTFNPLNGNVTSITDAKNQTEYYEYDSFNRLIAIKDQLGNIVKAFGFNYKQE